MDNKLIELPESLKDATEVRGLSGAPTLSCPTTVAQPPAIVACCTSLSRAEFHDTAWAIYHAKTLDDSMLAKMSIHSMRAIFDAIYDALPKVSPQPLDEAQERERHMLSAMEDAYEEGLSWFSIVEAGRVAKEFWCTCAGRNP
jgi:hypothetical protein